MKEHTTRNILAVVLAVMLVAVIAGCTPEEEPRPDVVDPTPSASQTLGPGPHEIASPAKPGSGEPFLATDGDGSILMTWIEPGSQGDARAVRYASWSGGSWSSPVTIVEADDLFVNWADFPSVGVAEDGTLFAHWLQKSSGDTYAYDVRISWSKDGGAHWSEPVVIHDDDTQTEHGFVSMVPNGDDRMSVVWLDGRNMAEGDAHDDGHGSMTIQYATIDSSGKVGSRAMLDDRTCECCQTSMTATPDGLVVAFRDRSDTEIRDIALVRQIDGVWTDPAIVAPDQWEIAGCPVNGPQVASSGEQVALAWFTASQGVSQVFVAFSSDGAASFADPIRVDDGSPIGRVDVEMLSDGSAVVTWIEQAGTEAEVRTKRLTSKGEVLESFVVGGSSPARSAGFPRTTASADDAVFYAWTQPGEPSTIRIATIRFAGAIE